MAYVELPRTDSARTAAVNVEIIPPPAAAVGIPGLIKRNTLLLAATQAFVGMGTQMMPTLSPILVVAMTGSPALAGLGTAVSNGSKVLIAYPIGYVTDRFGRRAGLLIGMLLALCGALTIGMAALQLSFPLFVAGILLFGIGQGATQQLRLAAADMYPPTRRAEGMGYVLTGSLVGAMGGPVLVSSAQVLSATYLIEPMAMPWFLVPVVLIPSMALVFFIRPDPREIAANLRTYYPGLAPTEWRAQAGTPAGSGFKAFVAHYPKRAAFVCSFGVQGTMTMMMAMTSLALAHHGHALPMISLAVALHVMGMYGLSIPMGRLTDRFGRRNVMLVGLAIQFISSVLVAVTPEYWTITAGTFLVGLGWSCVNVAASALIADTTSPEERGRAVGTNDTFSSASSIALPLLAGPFVALFGLGVLAIITTAVLVPPLVMLLRLRELSPGQYGT